MSMRALKTFLAIARHGTFAAAAREIGLTQAAVSLQVKGLEKELNTQLFDRIGRSAILNTSGRNLIPAATRILSLYEDMALTVSTGDLGGSLHIGAIPPTFANLLPEALLRLRRDHPRVEVRAISGVSDDLAAKVERGELDAALVSDPPESLAKALVLHPIVDEPLVFIAHKTLKMTDPRKVLSQEPFIWLARGSWTGRLIDQMLRQHRIQVQDVMELDMPELIAEMVARGFGVSIIPLYDGKWLKDRRLKIWRFGKPRMKRGVSLLQRRAHPRTVITLALLQCLLDVARNNRRKPIADTIEL
jgi:DNA-binding transcriptional LysR family regulator